MSLLNRLFIHFLFINVFFFFTFILFYSFDSFPFVTQCIFLLVTYSSIFYQPALANDDRVPRMREDLKSYLPDENYKLLTYIIRFLEEVRHFIIQFFDIYLPIVSFSDFKHVLILKEFYFTVSFSISILDQSRIE